MYSVPDEARLLFERLISDEALFIPSELVALASKTTITGTPEPSFPVIWRFSESIAALKALEGTFLNLLTCEKLDTAPLDVRVNAYVKKIINNNED